jgi:purine-binding chemotaxis protein CheW
MRKRLSVSAAKTEGKTMAIGIEHRSEHYGLIVDTIGEVLKLPVAGREPNPMNLDPCWAAVADGIQKLEDRLLVILNVDRVLELQQKTLAA